VIILLYVAFVKRTCDIIGLEALDGN
jgi:hypothetical protein